MIRSESAHFAVAAQTHPGMTGKNNEDRYAVTAYRLSRSDATPVILAVLCDGIGGHRAGEVAAEVAVDMITQTVAESDGRHPIETLQNAISRASDQIYALAHTDTNQQGMGATCACALVIDHQLYAATVGDSRIYLVRDQAIQQLSTDHTWIQEALEKGDLKPEDVAGHPNAHIIRRYLGSPSAPEADFRLRIVTEGNDSPAEANQGLSLQPGDQVLLCSDGLTDLVKDPEILATLKASPPEQAVQSLVDQANARGGHDNITVVLLTTPQPEPKAVPARIRWPWVAAGCAGIVLLAVLAGFALVSFGIIVINREPTATVTPTSTLPPLLQTALPGEQPPVPSPMPPVTSSTPTPTATAPFVSTPTPTGAVLLTGGTPGAAEAAYPGAQPVP